MSRRPKIGHARTLRILSHLRIAYEESLILGNA